MSDDDLNLVIHAPTRSRIMAALPEGKLLLHQAAGRDQADARKPDHPPAQARGRRVSTTERNGSGVNAAPRSSPPPVGGPQLSTTPRRCASCSTRRARDRPRSRHPVPDRVGRTASIASAIRPANGPIGNLQGVPACKQPFTSAAREDTLSHLTLTALVKTRLRRMQYRPGLLEGFLAKTRLDLVPSITSTIEDR
jgi:hypothetical protein